MVRTFKPIAGLAAASLLALAGCDDFTVTSSSDGVPLDKLDMGGSVPTELTLAGVDDVKIVEGDVFDVQVTGSEAALNQLRFEREGDRLSIGRDGKWRSGDGKATITVTMAAPTAIEVAGAGTVEAASLAREASVEAVGAAEANLTGVDADTLDVQAVGASTVSMSGKAKSLSLDVAGASKARMASLVADEVNADIVGASSAVLGSNGTVKADVAGASSLEVRGSAQCEGAAVGASSFKCGAKTQASPAAKKD